MGKSRKDLGAVMFLETIREVGLFAPVAAFLAVGAVQARAWAGPCAVVAGATPATFSVLPGQPIELTLRLRNASGNAISLSRPSELSGTVRAGVAEASAPTSYLGYTGPEWGLDCGKEGPIQLARAAVYTLPLKLLHHADRLSDPHTTIQTPFVFSAPGRYSLKLAYVDDLSCAEPGVSAVVSVHVLEPKGDDLAVWNEIKGCFACAKLLHTGRGNLNRAEQRAALEKLRDLSKRYPRATYMPLLKETVKAVEGKAKDK